MPGDPYSLPVTGSIPQPDRIALWMLRNRTVCTVVGACLLIAGFAAGVSARVNGLDGFGGFVGTPVGIFGSFLILWPRLVKRSLGKSGTHHSPVDD
jgi:hypothetical protein